MTFLLDAVRAIRHQNRTPSRLAATNDQPSAAPPSGRGEAFPPGLWSADAAVAVRQIRVARGPEGLGAACGLQDSGDVDHYYVAVRVKPGVGQLTRADLKLQFHRRATAIARHTALANIGRAFGEGTDQGEDGRSCLPDASRRAAPLEIEDVRVEVVGVGVGECQSLVAPTPCFDMRSEMKLGPLGHPGGLAECCDQLAGARSELRGVADASPAVIAIPPWRHRRKLQHS